MKYSKYNIIFSDNDIHYLWNTYSNAVSKLDEDTLIALQNFKDGTVISKEFPYYNYMEKNGFIVEESLDESNRLINRWQSFVDHASPKVLNITLAPTMRCNYECPYCFEEGKKNGKTMSKETADAVISFIRKKAENNPMLECISINGFGGEPLMNIDMLEYICNKVQRLCKEHEIKFKGHIVTNAFFLTQSITDRLVACGITSAQVTVDGMPEVYATSKGTTTGSFYRVVNNIVNACKVIKIAVRINVREDGYNDAIELTDYLLKDRLLDGLVSIYIANIRQYTETVETEKRVFSNWCEMSRKYMHLFEPCVGKYMATGLMVKGTKSRCAPCSNICRYNACIGPEGELYPCEHYFGDARYVCGSVYSGEKRTEMAERLRMARFPEEKECSNCPFAPVCLGGCPDDNMLQRNAICCDAYGKYLIDRKLFEIKVKHL